jgi:putative transposase
MRVQIEQAGRPGRKSRLVADTLGLLLAATLTAASVQDRDAAAVVTLACAKVPG